MDFIRRNINKTQRNGNIYINVSSGSYYGGGSSIVGGGSSSNEGNYLPATKNSDGTYTVDLTQVNFNGHIIAQGEVTAYGSGGISSGGTIIGSGGTSSGGTMLLIDIEDNLTSNRTDAALSANQGRLLKQMIDEKEVDLSNYYTKTEVDNELSFLDGNLSNYYTKTQVDEKNKIKLNKSIWDKIFEINSDGSLKVKVNLYGDGEISAFGSGTTENDINLDNYYTKDEIDYKLDNIDVGNVDVDLSDYYTKSQTDTKLSAYATTTALNNHTTSTTHITSTERTNWNAAYDNNHSHNNKSVIDGISSTNVTNWNKIASDWDNVFEINSDGSLKVKVNLYGDGEISSFGSGTTENEINLENYYTKDEVNDLIDNIDVGNVDVDLSNYYTKTQVESKLINKSDIDHTHSISNITNLQSALDGKSGTGHSHSNYSTTSHTHSNYATTSHTHPEYASSSHTHSISNITNLQSALDGKSGTGHSHSNYSVTSHTHSQYASSSHTHSISNITNLQSALDGKSGTGHSHSNYSLTSHTHSNYVTSNGTVANATTASKLSTTSKTAWGQTFWTSGGIPTSISGNMTGVGSISATGNITTSAEVTAHSDIRLKTNIKPLTVRGTLNPVQYIKDGKESIGFIANEVQELDPELVIVDESSDEKYLSLNYQQLTAVLYAEIIQLKNKIRELENRI